MSDCVMRGDIFYASLSHGIGSEQRGYRPVLIIQNNIGNKFSPTVIVAVITGKVNYKARLPTHCLLNLSSALSIPSMVLLEQIITIDKRRLKKYIGRISEKEITFINKALSVSVGLEGL
ncbi:type II toxin-antitoxin system PemK/MazF family toxin [Paratissierella segnis]|uniref:mRNA interferase n=1 Tax=Paratissierella segnis TaxID=2763679 RepID=A0A926IIT4_9FIRM|nr:type II toxin-antitoxin system PemK/MazF family toxin [Paratissierella segnis]MBC8586696.1 type II toxin-antitoxin system PemK/MazF family toxin [Paratissierella segnis]